MTGMTIFGTLRADGYYATTQVAAIVGLSYRQLDYLARTIDWTPGSGGHRIWSAADIRRLTIAKAIDAAAPGPGKSQRGSLPTIARAVLAGPPPPASGWAAYFRGLVDYGPTPTDAIGDLPGAVVAKLPGELRAT